MLDPLALTGLAVLGLLFGSFANVVIYRVPAGQSVVRPPSACPKCATELGVLDNIPVLSWLLLRGRCRACSARISARYPVVELLTAGLFALVGSRIEGINLVAYLPLVWVLVVLAFIDLDHKLLPNKIVLPATVAGLVLFAMAGAFGPGFDSYIRGLVAGVASFAVFLMMAIISPRGMGMGDVKLSFLLGLSLGYLGSDGVTAAGRTFIGFFIAFSAGAVGGLIFAVAKRAGVKAEIPFGPYLALGTVVSILWGSAMVEAWLG